MFRFPGQLEGEKVLKVVRKHPIVLLRILVGFLLTIVIPVLIFLAVWFGSLAGNPSNDAVVGVFISIYILYGLLFTIIAWINEAYDIFIVTNERLVDITQVTLLKRTVASTPLAQVQDATGHVEGLFGTLLNYGRIDVQTAAGDASQLDIDHVPDPNDVAHQILDWVKEKKSTGVVHAEPLQ